MNISSAIVIPDADRIDAVVAGLRGIAGVEVAAVSPEGKIIVAIEAEGDQETIRAYESVSLMDGVMSASMVYHQKEDEPEVEISLAA